MEMSHRARTTISREYSKVTSVLLCSQFYFCQSIHLCPWGYYSYFKYLFKKFFNDSLFQIIYTMHRNSGRFPSDGELLGSIFDKGRFKLVMRVIGYGGGSCDSLSRLDCQSWGSGQQLLRRTSAFLAKYCLLLPYLAALDLLSWLYSSMI